MINNKSKAIFEDMPIWKSIIKMAIPAMIMFLIYGIYNFSDNLLSINLASENYESLASNVIYNSKDLVRLFMSASAPLLSILFGIMVLVGQGVSKRYSIHLGAKNKEKAANVLQTAMVSSLMISLLIIPIMLLAAKPWIISIYSKTQHGFATTIADESFKYFRIIVIAFPIQIYNQVLSSSLRSEARNKSVLFSSITPIFINLFLDYVFMHLLGMDISGGALASLISWVVTALLLSFFVYKNNSEVLTFKNLFGYKSFSWITLIAILLVGMSPLIRSVSESISSTITTKMNQDLSNHVYGDSSIIIVLLTSTSPIIALLIPLVFSIVQGASPIIGYNYGAKNIKRMKEAVIYTIIFTCIISLIVYFLSNVLLPNLLFKFLGTTKLNVNFKGITYSVNVVGKAKNILKIVFLSPIFIAPTIGALSLYGSSDRLGISVLISLFRSFIVFIAWYLILYYISINTSMDVKSNLAKTNTMFSKEYLIWYFYVLTSITVSIISIIFMFFSFKKMDTNHKNLDERINNLINKLSKKKKIVN